MIRYQLVASYSALAIETCERCGKPIKNVYKVKDNALDTYIHVGSSCIDKVLFIENDSVKNTIIRKIEHLRKSLEDIENQLSTSLEDKYFEVINQGEWKTIYNADKQRNGYTRYEVYHDVISNRWYDIWQVIKEAKALNKSNKQLNFDMSKYENLVEELKNLMDEVKANKILPNELEMQLAETERLERIAQKEEDKRQQEEAEKEIYIGLESEKVDLKEVELIKIESEDGYYGTTYWYTFKKDKYNLVWKTTKDLELKENTILNIKGTIKENRNCKEGNFSYLTRCKIS